MSKLIRPNELAETITALLIRPDLLKAFNGSSQVHEEFIEAMGRVVTDFCGGEINCVQSADLPLDHEPDLVETAYLSVWPDSSLPSLENCVWALHDTKGWEGCTNAEFGLSDGSPQSDADVERLRERLQGLLIEAANAQRLRMNPTEKHSLKSFEDGARYIDALAAADLLYHFDDDPADCLSAHNLTNGQIEAIRHNVAQLFKIDWEQRSYTCPFDYMISNHP